MTDKNTAERKVEHSDRQASASDSQHSKAEDRERSEANLGLQSGSLNEEVKEKRKKQHASGRTGITGAGDEHGRFRSGKELLGDFAHTPQLAEGKAKSANREQDKASSAEAAFGTVRIEFEKEKQAGTDTPLFKVNLSSPVEPVDASKTAERSERKTEAFSKNEADKKLAQIDTATAQMLETAAQRFGSKSIEDMQIRKGDAGLAMSALLLGPDVCKFIGESEARNFGKRLIVFGVAPMFGMADEAKKQFTEHTMETTRDGSANFLTGTAIGAVLEHVHPLVLGTVTVAATGALIHDQFGTEENQKRNAKLVEISSRIENANNLELFQYSSQSKDLLGPDLYKAAFTVATGGAGLPEGKAVRQVADEETAQLAKKINMKALFEEIRTMPAEAWQSMSNFMRPIKSEWELAPAGSASEMHLAMAKDRSGSPEDNIFRILGITGSESGFNFARFSKSLETEIEKLARLPVHEKFESLPEINKRLMIKEPVMTQAQADALASLDESFIAQFKLAREEASRLKAQARLIEEMPESKRSVQDEDLLEAFYKSEDSMYELVTDRLKSLYGWDGRSVGIMDRSISMQSGFGAQRQVSNGISEVLKAGLDKNDAVLKILKDKGVPSERAKDWIGIPAAEKSGCDHAGCDYLLVNKSTGEFYAIDATERTMGMRTGRLVDTRMTNGNLEFPGKDVPLERKDFVIGVADQTSKDNLIFRAVNENNFSAKEAEAYVRELEQKQLAEIIATCISRPSPLNIFDTPLPSSNAALPASRVAYELWRYRTKLEEIGYSDWARSITRSIGYIRSQNSGIPFFRSD